MVEYAHTSKKAMRIKTANNRKRSKLRRKFLFRRRIENGLAEIRENQAWIGFELNALRFEIEDYLDSKNPLNANFVVG